MMAAIFLFFLHSAKRDFSSKLVNHDFQFTKNLKPSKYKTTKADYVRETSEEFIIKNRYNMQMWRKAEKIKFLEVEKYSYLVCEAGEGL